MKKVIILSVLLGFTFASQAQTFEDAVQFSRIQNWGTARSAGMAGAFGALGGDLSTLSANPVSYTHLTLPTTPLMCRSRWSPYH